MKLAAFFIFAVSLFGQSSKPTALTAIFNAELLRNIGIPLPGNSASMIRTFVYDQFRDSDVYRVVTEYDDCGDLKIVTAYILPVDHESTDTGYFIGVTDIQVRNVSCVLVRRVTITGLRSIGTGYSITR